MDYQKTDVICFDVKKILQLKTEITQIERFLKILSCPYIKKSMAY